MLGHCFLSLWCQRCKKGGGGAATQREGGKKGCRPFMFNDGIFNDRNSRCIAKINLYANPVYTTFEKPRFASSLVSLHLFMFNVIRKLEERREREEGGLRGGHERKKQGKTKLKGDARVVGHFGPFKCFNLPLRCKKQKRDVQKGIDQT